MRLNGLIPWRSRRSALIVGGALIATIGIIAWFVLGHRGGDREGAATQHTATITTEPFSVSLGLNGVITPGDIVSVTAPFDGRVATVAFAVGSTVQKGGVLVTLDTSEVDQKRDQAEAEYLKAAQSAGDMTNWSHGPEMAQARRAATAAATELADTRRKVSETKALLDRGLVARDEYDGLVEQQRSQEMALEAAHEELDETMKRGSGANRRVTELELETAKAQFANAQAESANSVVRAPVAGVIVRPPSDRGDAPGQTIHPGTSLTRSQLIAAIARPDGLAVSFDLSEADANRIRPGQAVEVTGPGFAGVTLHGSVTSVAREANPTSAGSGVGVSFTGSAHLDDVTPAEASSIRIGMSANISIDVYRNAAALVAPAGAIQGASPDTFVTVRDRGAVRRRSVRIGQVSADKVEILSGLKPGDVVVWSESAAQNTD